MKLREIYRGSLPIRLARKSEVCIFESPPQNRTIRIEGYEGVQRFYLSFPYMQFSCVDVTYESRYETHSPMYYLLATWSRTSFTWKTRLSFPFLPNIFEDGSVCLGYPAIDPTQRIGQFWHSTFNLLDGWDGEDMTNKVFGNYEGWEARTRSHRTADWILSEEGVWELLPKMDCYLSTYFSYQFNFDLEEWKRIEKCNNPT